MWSGEEIRMGVLMMGGRIIPSNDDDEDEDVNDIEDDHDITYSYNLSLLCPLYPLYFLLILPKIN